MTGGEGVSTDRRASYQTNILCSKLSECNSLISFRNMNMSVISHLSKDIYVSKVTPLSLIFGFKLGVI